MRPSLIRPTAMVAGFAVLLALVAVGAQQVTARLRDAPTEQPSPFSITVDHRGSAPVTELAGIAGAPRPIASIVDEDGIQADFVENELILTTDDQAQLEAFLARWNGELLSTLDPAEYNLDGLTAQHLVRVDAPAADPSALAQHLDPDDRDTGGAHRVSSDAGLWLLTAGAAEAAAGRPVELNWVMRDHDFRDRVSSEAPTAHPLYAAKYPGPNAFTWPSHHLGSEQDIAVAEAWRGLEIAGKLDTRVKIAIVDQGFRLNEDTPPGWRAGSVVPGVHAFGPNPSAQPWHGQWVLNAAMAVADNGYGGAGPGGPVAKPIMIRVVSDAFHAILGLAEARRVGANIVNLSFGAAIPGGVAGFTADSYRAMIKSLRNLGVLVFAAAGNDGIDIDAETCYVRFYCRERVTVVPCEVPGVICVGGLESDSRMRHPGSRYGADDVDIFAPYEVWMATGDAAAPNQAVPLEGTSYSSPFAAGVAALVWAANPELSADEVEAILMETAHDSPDSTVGRYVNALEAVQAAANLPPELTVHSPPDGAQLPAGVPITFVATADDYEDGEYCCAISWLSSGFTGIRIPIGSGDRVEHTFTGPGRYTIEVTARDSGGRTDSARLMIEVVNTPPSVQITRPTSGESIRRDARYVARATAADPNEPGGRLDCDRLRWTSSVAVDPFPQTGCSAEVRFPTARPRTLTVTATDSHGATGTASVQIGVGGSPPGAEAPTVQIRSPSDGGTIANRPRGLLGLRWEATDPAAAGLEHAWSVTFPYDPATGVGGTTEPIVEREVIYPSPWIAWMPFDNLGEVYCDLDGGPVRVRLEVTDAAGRTGSDFVVLHTEPCIIVD